MIKVFSLTGQPFMLVIIPFSLVYILTFIDVISYNLLVFHVYILFIYIYIYKPHDHLCYKLIKKCHDVWVLFRKNRNESL